MAPEIVKHEGHSFPVDYYCIGALIYEMATGLAPFDGQSEKEIFYDILYKPI
jgi:serum/glucocorticoid-regulated kinase 2